MIGVCFRPDLVSSFVYSSDALFHEGMPAVSSGCTIRHRVAHIPSSMTNLTMWDWRCGHSCPPPLFFIIFFKIKGHLLTW